MPTRFPTALATDADLLVAKNRAQTTLVGALNASDTSFTLASDAFAANVAITIDSEIILIVAKSGATVTICTRGYDNTAAASHTSGKLVSAYIDAVHHEAIKREVIAIENALGVNLENITALIPNPTPIANGGTGATTQADALSNILGASALPVANGGTAASTAASARASLGVAELGANVTITSLSGLTTPLSVPQGGSGAATLTGIVQGSGASALSAVAAASQLQVLRRKPNVTGAVYEFASPVKAVSSDYNFPVQATPEGLSPTLKTITLTPVPLGVNNSNTAHYLAIFDNSGVFQESVLINGGSAVGGVASGTLTFSSIAGTYAAGSYKIGSATAGIQEAVRTVAVTNSYAFGPSVEIPAGKWPIYATITVDNYASISGAGSNSTILQKAFASGDLLYIGDATTTLSGIASIFRDFMIQPLSGVTDTGGYAMHLRFRYNPSIENVTMYGDGGIGRIKNGIKFDSCLTFSLVNTKILNVTNIGLELTSTGLDQVTGRIVAVDVTSPGTTNDLVYFHGNVLSMFIDGLQMQGGYRNWHINTTGGQFTESQINAVVFDSAANTAFTLDGTGATFKNNFSNIELSTISGVPSMLGMVFDGTGASVFTAMTITNLVGGVNASNNIGTALFLLSVTNFLVSNSQIQGAGAGVGDTGIQIQGTTANVILTGNVIGYAYDGSTSGSHAYRAVYVPSGTHAGMTLTGNRVYGSSVALGIAGAHTALMAKGNSLAGGVTTSFTGTGTAYFDNPADPAGLNGAVNYIASETGANNAIAAALTAATLATGLRVTILLAHTLQAGANTFNLNAGGALAIKSVRNPANNIATAWAVGGVITLRYDGTQWLDVSQ